MLEVLKVCGQYKRCLLVFISLFAVFSVTYKTTSTSNSLEVPELPIRVKNCVFEDTKFTGSTKFLSRNRSLKKGEKVRSIKASIRELGSIDVLISRCHGSIHPHLFKFDNFQCIPGLKFWVYEKCPVEMYKPPEHMLPCIRVIPYNFYTGLSGTLLSHIVGNYDNLANFTVNLKDTAKKLYMNDALLNLKLHLSTVKSCTGFLGLSDQPVLARKFRRGRSFRAVSFNYGKHIPEMRLLDPLTFLRKTKDMGTQGYCEKFTRYTCRKCTASLVSTRQQLLLSRTRILRYPRVEYLSLQNWTYALKQKSSSSGGNGIRRDDYGFEYTYSIIFTCYQIMDKSLMRRIHRGEFPIVHCHDSTC